MEGSEVQVTDFVLVCRADHKHQGCHTPSPTNTAVLQSGEEWGFVLFPGSSIMLCMQLVLKAVR